MLSPSLKGEARIGRGQRALPVFHLLAERYLDPRYSPDAVAPQTGIPAATIRRIAAELAQAAFREAITLDVPWTDVWGNRHERMLGRPVSVHAMRGISAHSNGFHTCRALHLLQALLGSIDVPGGFRYKPPFPKPAPPGPKPAGRPGQVAPGQPMPGPPLGYPAGPEDLLVEADGSPRRIDKAFSWEAPLAVHGMMHMVITNAFHGDPYPIDTLFLYMANMAWNSAMNVRGTLEMLTARDPVSGDYRIPRIIYADAYFSEMVAYADLILPDTTYLERWDCISLLDRPISKPEGPADAIRQPVLEPDRDVRPFQDVLLDLGARLGLPGMVDQDGNPAFPEGYTDYLVHHERKPGIGSLAGWRGDGSRARPRPAQPRPAAALRRARLLLAGRAGPRPVLLQARQPGLSRLRGADGLHRPCGARHFPALQRGAAKIPAGGAGGIAGRSRHASIGRASRPTSILCRSGIRRSTTATSTCSRCTRSRSGRWRCITPGARRTPGCGSCIPATASISAVRAPARWGCAMATGSGSSAGTAGSRCRSG